MSLPKYVHRQVGRNGKVTLTYQRYRGTPAAGPRIKLPSDPQSAEFWAAYKQAHEGPVIEEKSGIR